jgi:coenzyme F420-reducing hydrogenase alpha subunit
LAVLMAELEWGLEAALKTVELVSGFSIPPFTTDYEFVAISHPDEYPFNEGRVVSTEGVNLDMQEFRDFFKETQVEHCNSLHSYRVGGKSYHTGPLARLNINAGKLRPRARQALAQSGLRLPTYNPFESIIVRAIELVQCFEEAIEIISTYQPPAPSLIQAPARAGEASWITEAPRGMCFHHYKLDSNGLVESADIRAPTSQNYARMEDDLREFVPDVLDLPLEDATWRCEQLIRCYDPCISCSVHFLKLNIHYK